MLLYRVYVLAHSVLIIIMNSRLANESCLVDSGDVIQHFYNLSLNVNILTFGHAIQ